MSEVLHPIEKKIIILLKEKTSLSLEKIVEKTQLSTDQVRRGIEWLRLKGLANVTEDEIVHVSLGEKSKKALLVGLPERKLVMLIHDKPKSFDEIKKELPPEEFNPAIANSLKNNWIEIDKNVTPNVISLKGTPLESRQEKLIKYIGGIEKLVSEIDDIETLSSLKKRPDFIKEKSLRKQSVSLSEEGKKIDIDYTRVRCYNIFDLALLQLKREKKKFKGNELLCILRMRKIQNAIIKRKKIRKLYDNIFDYDLDEG